MNYQKSSERTNRPESGQDQAVKDTPSLLNAAETLLFSLPSERGDVAYMQLTTDEKVRRYDAAVLNLRAAITRERSGIGRTESDFDAANLALFVRVARNGSSPGASGGEKICNRLAKMLQQIGDDAAVIDLELIDGACTLLKLQHGPWRTDADKSAVFKMTARAAGR